MRVVVQRVNKSSVSVDGKVVGKIDKGFTLLVGFTHDDNSEIVDKMVKKVLT